MPTLQQAATAWAQANPLTPTRTSWQNGCARLQYDWNASYTPGWATHGSVTTAMNAMSNSSILSTDPAQILPGRFVWLSLPGVPAGHVGQCVSGEGLDALIFWATDVLQIPVHPFIGFGTVREYAASAHRGKFLGVSEDYAGALPNLAAFSSVGPVTPIPPTPILRRNMYIIYNTSGGGMLVTETGVTSIQSAQELALIQAVMFSDQSSDASQKAGQKLLPSDFAIVAAVLARCNQPVDPAALATAIAADITIPAPVVDNTPVLTAISNLPTLAQHTALAGQVVGNIAADITVAQQAIIAKLPVATPPTAAQIASAVVAAEGAALSNG